MRSKVLVVVLALVLGGVAAVLAANYLNGARTDLAAQNEPIEVLVAQEDLPRGLSAKELVERDYVKVEKIPAQFVAADAVSSERVLADQVLATPVTEGEQLTRSRFEFPSAAGLSYSVPEEMVAVSCDVQDSSGVAGLLKAGDNVIVFQTYEPAGKPTAFTITAVPKAKVLAVGANTSAAPAEETESGGGLTGGDQADSGQPAYRTVTLALTPEQAESIAFAQSVGTIHLALLGPNAKAPEQPGLITLETVSNYAKMRKLQ